MENLNYFDIIVLALILMLGLKGLMRGFLNEIFSLLGIGFGVYLASRSSMYVGELISSNIIPIEGENTLLLVGFLLTLIVVWILFYIFGIIISKIFKISGLGIVDKLFGFIFGAGKVFIIFAIIITALSRIDIINNKLKLATKISILYPLLKDTGSIILKLDPQQIKDNIDTNIENISGIINENNDTIDSNQSK